MTATGVADLPRALSYYLVTKEERTMTRIAKIVVMAALLIAGAQVSAQVKQGQTMYGQRNGYWNSFLLILGNSVNSRATTSAVDGSSVALSIDFTPPKCEPLMEFGFSLDHPARRDVFRNDVLITMRTDNGVRANFTGAGYTTMGDTFGLIYVLNSTNLLGQIGEMSRGQTLRVKIVYGNDESDASYNTYSMTGMTAAFRRAQQMCINPASLRR